MFKDEYEFVKHYIDTSGVNSYTAIDIACDIDINYLSYTEVYNKAKEYITALGVDEEDREEFLLTLEEYYNL